MGKKNSIIQISKIKILNKDVYFSNTFINIKKIMKPLDFGSNNVFRVEFIICLLTWELSQSLSTYSLDTITRTDCRVIQTKVV